MCYSARMSSRRRLGSIVMTMTCIAALATSGCASEEAEPATPSESAVVAVERLDRVTPAEVAAAFDAQIGDQLQRCVDRSEAPTVDRANLNAFYRPGSDSFWDVKELVELMFVEQGVDSLPVAGLRASVVPVVTTFLGKAVDADGFYVPTHDGSLLFYLADLRAREQKAIAQSKAPGGRSLGDVREMWKKVEATGGTLDSAWLNPVKVSGEPSITEVKKTMRVPFAASMTAWGFEAVDGFHGAGEGPDGTPVFEPLGTFLRSNAIKKRWLFQGGGDKWSTNVLVVLDEHDQLWGMQMGYSE